MDDEGFQHRVIAMSRPSGSIRDLISNPTGRSQAALAPEPPPPTVEPAVADEDYSPPPKKSDPVPRPGDAYRAYARFLNRLSIEPKLIHFVKKNFDCEGYSYADLRRVRWERAGGPGTGPVLVLRFVEAVVIEVRISGRNLDDLHHWIGEHSMPWVWEQPDGFRTRDDAATVITGIAIQETER